MADVIEVSKSSRATCRACKQKIDKGILRFGEETPNAFDPDGGSAYRWHHLECAAGRIGARLKTAMDAFAGPIPQREKLDALLVQPPKSASKGGANARYPYAERAATGRSKCMHCEEPIAQGTLRIAVEREVDTGSFTTTGPGYLHPACALEHTGDEAWLEKVKGNSTLEAKDVTELEPSA